VSFMTDSPPGPMTLSWDYSTGPVTEVARPTLPPRLTRTTSSA